MPKYSYVWEYGPCPIISANNNIIKWKTIIGCMVLVHQSGIIFYNSLDGINQYQDHTTLMSGTQSKSSLKKSTYNNGCMHMWLWPGSGHYNSYKLVVWKDPYGALTLYIVQFSCYKGLWCSSTAAAINIIMYTDRHKWLY